MMEAMCPHCGRAGCEKCNGKGTLTVGFSKTGVYHHRHCKTCGMYNGARLSDPPKYVLPPKPEPCVFCGSEDMEWVPFDSE